MVEQSDCNNLYNIEQKKEERGLKEVVQASDLNN